MYTEQVDTLFKYLGVKLHTRYNTSPISLTRIVSAFNITIGHLPFDDEISGMLVRSNKGPYILINSNQHYNRRRFSLGHEFGHYYLGHPSDITTVLPEEIRRQVEVCANKFSSCILMPVQLITELVKNNKTIPEIAKWLRVSVIAAAIRCRNLGYRIQEAEDIISQYWLEMGDQSVYEFDFVQPEHVPV